MNRNWKSVVAGGVVALGGSFLVWGSLTSQALADKADLQVYSVTCTNAATQGSQVTVVDVTTNAAMEGAAVGSTTYIYLCTNLTSYGLTPILNHAVPALAAGSTYTCTSNVSIPSTQTLGTNRFIVVANATGSVSESKKGDNTNTAIIVISAQ